MAIERAKKKSGVVTVKASICRTRLQPSRFFSLDRTCLNIFTVHVALAYVLTVGILQVTAIPTRNGRRNSERNSGLMDLLRSRVATFTYQ